MSGTFSKHQAVLDTHIGVCTDLPPAPGVGAHSVSDRPPMGAEPGYDMASPSTVQVNS